MKLASRGLPATIVHLFLSDPDFEKPLVEELRPAVTQVVPDLGLMAEVDLAALRCAAFARQVLPDVHAVSAASINAWADTIIDAVAGVLPDEQPWRLHLWPVYGEGRAGMNRCALIRTALMERMKKRRRHLLRSLEDVDSILTPQTSLVQAVLTAPDAGWLSVCRAPAAHALRGLISPFIGGWLPWAEDKNAPSRAFAKLVESERRLGKQIAAGETVVDLGAAPGSWTYIALQRGAFVTALDRSELREDLMRNPRLRFQTGDAFKFAPPEVVDWLICDVIAAPLRSIDLLLEWLRDRRMRNFVVTIKFQGGDEYGLLRQLKEHAASHCEDFHLKRLCANKNEVCAFGRV